MTDLVKGWKAWFGYFTFQITPADYLRKAVAAKRKVGASCGFFIFCFALVFFEVFESLDNVSAFGRGAGCRCIPIQGFCDEFSAQAIYVFHPYEVCKLVPGLQKCKRLIFPSGATASHCVGQIRIQITSSTSYASRVCGSP